MALFDSIIGEATKRFGLSNDAAGGLLSALLAFIADPQKGGFGGFVDRFRNVGLEPLMNSWITKGDNVPLSNEQLESALGEDNIRDIADSAGVEKSLATTAMAGIIPSVVDQLTPEGELPDENSLLGRISGFVSGWGGASAGAFAGQTVDRIDAAAGAAYGERREAVTDLGDRISSTAPGTGGGSILRWLLPLLLLALLIAMGFWFCGRPSTPVGPANANMNVNTTPRNNVSAPAKSIDSSISIKAENGKYSVTGVVPDEATKKQIVNALTTQYGAENVNFDGLRVDAAAKPLNAGWSENFAKMLPRLNDWRTGTLTFTGNAVTEATGLPAAAVEQLKSLFSGWTLPSSLGVGGGSESARTLGEVSLPDGTKLQAYPGGIEDQLVKFVGSNEYKNASNDQLKDEWFNFDDLNFKFGTTELAPESKRQLDNIVAILKAFPDVKIKIGGYTDKKGDNAVNLKLSDGRAKAVQAALQKAGVGGQVPEAEGYGEQFATVDENASDDERKVDRRTAIRIIK